jgi:tRNA (guanine37-N1)-methyltransferase
VPEVLLSGHHARIARWRREQAIRRTARWRPDLLDRVELTPEERAIAEEILSVDRALENQAPEPATPEPATDDPP